jgi:hypothetical protein
MQLDGHTPSSRDDLDAASLRPDEAVHAVDLARRVGRVAREHVGRDDDGPPLPDLRTSSVTSGRAKKRKGTNVVPRPGETWSVTPPARYSPRSSGAEVREAELAAGIGSTIWPACMWPASTSW